MFALNRCTGREYSQNRNGKKVFRCVSCKIFCGYVDHLDAFNGRLPARVFVLAYTQLKRSVLSHVWPFEVEHDQA